MEYNDLILQANSVSSLGELYASQEFMISFNRHFLDIYDVLNTDVLYKNGYELAKQRIIYMIFAEKFYNFISEMKISDLSLFFNDTLTRDVINISIEEFWNLCKRLVVSMVISDENLMANSKLILTIFKNLGNGEVKDQELFHKFYIGIESRLNEHLLTLKQKENFYFSEYLRLAMKEFILTHYSGIQMNDEIRQLIKNISIYVSPLDCNNEVLPGIDEELLKKEIFKKEFETSLLLALYFGYTPVPRNRINEGILASIFGIDQLFIGLIIKQFMDDIDLKLNNRENNVL